VPKFLAKHYGNALLNFLSYHQCDTHDMHNKFHLLPATEQSEREAVIHACAQGSKVTCFPLLAPSISLFKRKNDGEILFDEATCTE
jgi:hypothetical protein